MSAKKPFQKNPLNVSRLAEFAQLAVTPADGEIDVKLIRANKQVRSNIGDLTELAASIKAIGVIEPIVVHEQEDFETGDVFYELIAGERRWRGSILAGKEKIPAVIKRNLSDFEIRQMQVTENNEREDLSPYDEAMGVVEDVEKYNVIGAMSIWNRSEGWISKRVGVKKYAEPVLDILKSGLSGDLEALGSLNQLYTIDRNIFDAYHEQLKEGLPLVRATVRDKVTLAKAHKDSGAAKKRQAETARVETELPEEANKDSAEGSSGESSDTVGQQTSLILKTLPVTEKPKQAELPSVEKTEEQLEQEAKIKAEEEARKAYVRLSEISGDIYKALSAIKTHHEMNGSAREVIESQIFRGIAQVTLHAASVTGDLFAPLYIKKLQAYVKSKPLKELISEIEQADSASSEWSL